MKTPRLVRTTSFRLTALYAGLFVASMALLFGIVYWVATDVLDEQMRLSVQSEMDSLEAKASTDPTGELAVEIARRLASGRPQSFYYGVQDPTGRKLAGNLPVLDGFEEWHRVTLQEEEIEGGQTGANEDHERILLALGRRLSDGRFLVVAADTYRIRESAEAIIRSFGWATGIGLSLALLGGVTLSHKFLRRLDEINRTTSAIVRGDLADRIQTGTTDDELDRLGNNLNAMLDRIQNLMDGLKQVSNDIAHDLRTPLSRLKQGLEAARLDATTIEDYEEAVDQALREADTALSTFGALLRIAQVESGTRRTNFADLDLSALVANLATTYAAVAEDAGKTLNSSVDPGLHIRGDRELLTQLLVNLIENALRHTPDGARVGLFLRNGDDGPVAEVSDDGPGIPETERGNVFKRFYRLEGSRSTPGSGLGLALVAAVADLHGTRIELSDNSPGLKVMLRFKKEIRP